MIIYYAKGCSKTIYHLLSYLDQFSSAEYETRRFDPKGNLDEIENSGDNYLLLSAVVPRHLVEWLAVLERLRRKVGDLKINVVLGGSLFYVLDVEDAVRQLPGVTHACEGNGEEFLKTLVEKRLPPGAYRGKQFGRIQHYRLTPKYLKHLSRLFDYLLISFDDNRCRWRRCLFCHHQNADELTRNVVPVDQVVDDVAYYYEHGFRDFYFYDNELNPRKLNSFLARVKHVIGPDPRLVFRVFGMRVTSIPLIDPGEIWRPGLISELSIGVEFYSQDLLDTFGKGITIEQIDRAIEVLQGWGIPSELYLLLAVPGFRTTHYEDICRLIGKYGSRVKFRPSFFRLTAGTPIYEMRDRFGIERQTPYVVSELAGGGDLPPIRTNYWRFTCFDEEEQTRVDDLWLYQKARRLVQAALAPTLAHTWNAYLVMQEQKGHPPGTDAGPVDSVY